MVSIMPSMLVNTQQRQLKLVILLDRQVAAQLGSIPQ
jgi:hypothetical protein